MFLLLFVCFTLISVGCGNKSKSMHQVLVKADSVLESDPESVYSMLDSIILPESYPEEEFAYWCLLYSRVLDKCFKTHETDSLIKIAVNYYRKENDSIRLTEALYTFGRIRKELGDVKGAVTAFLESLDISKHLEYDLLTYKTSSQLGTVYLYEYMYDQADTLFHIAYDAAYKTGEKTYLSYAQSYLARLYAAQHKFSDAVESYLKAISLADPSSAVRQLAIHELVGVYVLSNDYKSAYTYLDSCSNSIGCLNRGDSTKVFLSLGTMYNKLGDGKKASFYLNLASLSDNLYTRRSAYLNLYRLCKKENKYSDAIKYNEQYWICSDSILKWENQKEVLGIKSRYNHKKLQVEKQETTIIAEKRKVQIYLSLMCLFAVSAGFLFFLLRQNRKLLRIKNRLDGLNRILDNNRMIINNNDRELAILQQMLEQKNAEFDCINHERQELEKTNSRNLELLEDLSFKLLSKQNDIDSLQKRSTEFSNQNALISVANEKLKKRIQDQLIELQRRGESITIYQKLLERKEAYPNILLRLKKTKQIQGNEWDELFAMIDALHKNFTVRIFERHPGLTEKDLRLCCLIKLGYETLDLENILNIEEDSLYKSKKRLRQRLDKNRKWNKGDLEAYILSF